MASTVTYTLIPCDASEPLQELKLQVPPTLEENIGCLTAALNDHYRRVAPIKSAADKQAIVDSVKQQLKKNQPHSGAPDESMLSALAASQTCDIVQLIPATQKSGYVGVSMYVDDKGQGKGSAHNVRASQICGECGVPTDVLGDAFIARAWDDQDGFERRDFTVAELDSNAAWVQEAKRLNANRADPAAAAKQLSSLSHNPPPPPPEQPLPARLAAASGAKASGTECFKQGDVEGAASKYDAAVQMLGGPGGVVGDGGKGVPDAEADLAASAVGGDDLRAAAELLVTCLVNLAMCRLRQERPYEAIAAADSAIALDEANGKAWYRRGQACMALSQFGAARRNLSRAATLLPSSREVRADYAKCTELAAAQKKANGMFDVSDGAE